MPPSQLYCLQNTPKLRFTYRSGCGDTGTVKSAIRYLTRVCLLLAALALSQCARYNVVARDDAKATIPDGRFSGPLEVPLTQLPAMSARGVQGNEMVTVKVTLTARCAPQLMVGWPDGTEGTFGNKDARWQALLAARATAPNPEPTTPSPSTQNANVPFDPYPPPYSQSATSGSFQAVSTESWPGQLDFMRLRDAYCGERRTYTKTYETMLLGASSISFWSTAPQEIAEASLQVQIEYKRKGEDLVAARERQELKFEVRPTTNKPVVVATAKPIPQKPIPKKPKDKKEKQRIPATSGAVWIPGTWHYYEGEGKWVWIAGSFAKPSAMPALRGPARPRPIEGSTWQDGTWVWEPGVGVWQWHDGQWLAPAPLLEDKSSPPHPESQWVSGSWQSAGVSFRWTPGKWIAPPPRTETIPSLATGLRWVPGEWFFKAGTYHWMPGFVYNTQRKPPPLTQEARPRAPSSQAVWLAGFWQLSPSNGDYSWVPGHWEQPPGIGYVWVADPPRDGGASSGRWILDATITIQAPTIVVPNRR